MSNGFVKLYDDDGDFEGYLSTKNINYFVIERIQKYQNEELYFFIIRAYVENDYKWKVSPEFSEKIVCEEYLHNMILNLKRF